MLDFARMLATLTPRQLREELAACNADPCPDHSISADYRAAVVRELARRGAK